MGEGVTLGIKYNRNPPPATYDGLWLWPQEVVSISKSTGVLAGGGRRTKQYHPIQPILHHPPSLAGYFILLVLVLTQVLSPFLWIVVGEKGLKEELDMEQNGHGGYKCLCGHKNKY